MTIYEASNARDVTTKHDNHVTQITVDNNFKFQLCWGSHCEKHNLKTSRRKRSPACDRYLVSRKASGRGIAWRSTVHTWKELEWLQEMTGSYFVSLSGSKGRRLRRFRWWFDQTSAKEVGNDSLCFICHNSPILRLSTSNEIWGQCRPLPQERYQQWLSHSHDVGPRRRKQTCKPKDHLEDVPSRKWDRQVAGDLGTRYEPQPVTGKRGDGSDKEQVSMLVDLSFPPPPPQQLHK